MKIDYNIAKMSTKIFIILVFEIIAIRLSQGYAIPIIALVGVGYALTDRIGWAIGQMAFLAFLVQMNPLIIGAAGGAFAIGVRAGPLLIGLALALRGMNRQGSHTIPIGMITLYMLCAFISSMQGYAPVISYLKIINLAVFLIGIQLGTRNLHRRPKDIYIFRSFLIAIAMLLILGSAALIPFPSISTLSAVQIAAMNGDVTKVAAMAEDLAARMPLFCGITRQSQVLAPMLSCFVGLVMCDMLFIERRFGKLHLAMICLSIPILYMTHSRTGLVSYAMVLFLVCFCTGKKMDLQVSVRKKLKTGMAALLCMIFAIIVVGEIKDRSFTKLLRKTDDVTTDNRNLTEAMTESRMGLVEQNMYDFRRNMILGSGFQVSEQHIDLMSRSKGLILTAPIEKGVLPLMILGEGGIVGAIAFIAFLCVFYTSSYHKKLFVTMTMMTVLLALNMGEATFFSPGGSGGVEWIVCIVGGFALDTAILFGRQKNMPILMNQSQGYYGYYRPGWK